MTNRRENPPYLRLIISSGDKHKKQRFDFEQTESQLTLFPLPKTSLIIFLSFSETEENEFLTILNNTRPTMAIDLRPMPRFDIGRLNRKEIFHVFRKLNTKYYDLSGLIGAVDKRDARLNPALVSEKLRDVIFKNEDNVAGPVMFIIDLQQNSEQYIGPIIRGLAPKPKSGWDVYRFPAQKS